ncbi:MAG TPA: hypothetical protein VG672_17560, partial [Bryobacteraceae bacterium]|nr:hypothetical protein [Bryobacteraceae bacterium]
DKLRGQAQFERLLRDRRASTRDAVQTAEAVAAPPLRKQKPRRRFWWTAAAILAAVLGVVAYYWFRPLPRPFQGVRVSRITTNGIAESAVISPDGALVAYTVRNQGSATVWIRDLRNRSTSQVAGPFESLVPLLEFTRDGKNLAFVTRPVNDPAGGALYFVSAAGGAPQLVLSGLSTPVGVAPDGKHVALYRTEAASGSEQLVVAELKQAGGQISAGRERVVFSRRHPDKFVSQPGPVWSPDGMRIACAMRGPRGVAYGAALFLVSLDGSVQLLHTPAWQNIGGIAWMKHSHALLVVGQHPDDPFQQIWHVPLGRGASTRITNDFTNYNTVSLTADESAMISVQIQSISNLYVTRPGESARPVQITPGAGRYFDVAWTPSGSLVYASDATGSAEIWTMDANGKNLRQLTSGPGRSYGPSVSPDGRTIVFHSNRGGVWNIWKMDASGRNPAQLTHDSSDSTFAKFMPDGAGLVYQHLGDDARQSIWKIPLQGVSSVRLTSTHTMYPAVSSRGLIAVWSSLKPEEPARVIAVYQPGAAEPLRLFGFPINRMPGMFLRWMPQSDAISYIETIDGVSNIWMQPIAGGPPKMLTNFTAGRIYSFDWSRDGRLAYSQGMTTSDVVLMRGADQQ